jgi:HTH-type transcriptional regulator, cell division transcriptional repressor
VASGRQTAEKQAIGKRVAEARRRAGLTQKELAARIGVGQRAVQGWELGRSHPYRRLAALERVLKVNRDWLLRGNAPGHAVEARVELEDPFLLSGQLEDLNQESIASPARPARLPASLERRLAAIEKRLDRLERR